MDKHRDYLHITDKTPVVTLSEGNICPDIHIRDIRGSPNNKHNIHDTFLGLPILFRNDAVRHERYCSENVPDIYSFLDPYVNEKYELVRQDDPTIWIETWKKKRP